MLSSVCGEVVCTLRAVSLTWLEPSTCRRGISMDDLGGGGLGEMG